MVEEIKYAQLMAFDAEKDPTEVDVVEEEEEDEKDDEEEEDDEEEDEEDSSWN